jgi:hypothetical protein
MSYCSQTEALPIVRPQQAKIFVKDCVKALLDISTKHVSVPILEQQVGTLALFQNVFSLSGNRSDLFRNMLALLMNMFVSFENGQLPLPGNVLALFEEIPILLGNIPTLLENMLVLFEDMKELTEDETEKTNTPGYVDPQLFGNSRLIVKVVIERASAELAGARRLWNKLDSLDRSQALLVPPIFYAPILWCRVNEKPTSIFGFESDSIESGCQILEFMVRAQGISLEKFCRMHSYEEFSSLVPVFENLATAIRSMHNLEICHCDLHTRNVIVDPKTFKVSFVDFERVSFGNICYCSSEDIRKIFHILFSKYLFVPSIENPSIFERMEGVMTCLESFLHNYYDSFPELDLAMPLCECDCTYCFTNHILQEKYLMLTKNKTGGESEIDSKMFVACKIMLRFIPYVMKLDIKNNILYHRIAEIMKGNRPDPDLNYAYKISDLFSTMFFNFPEGRIIEFIEAFNIPPEKEWIELLRFISRQNVVTC